MFLDSITVAEVENNLGRKLNITYNDGYDLVQNILDDRVDDDV